MVPLFFDTILVCAGTGRNINLFLDKEGNKRDLL